MSEGHGQVDITLGQQPDALQTAGAKGHHIEELKRLNKLIHDMKQPQVARESPRKKCFLSLNKFVITCILILGFLVVMSTSGKKAMTGT